MLKRLLIPPIMCLVLVACVQFDTSSPEVTRQPGNQPVVPNSTAIFPTPPPTESTMNFDATVAPKPTAFVATLERIEKSLSDSDVGQVQASDPIDTDQQPTVTPQVHGDANSSGIDSDAEDRQGINNNIDSAPAPPPIGTVVYYETSVTLPTYPYERYQTDAFDPVLNWPFKQFDRERFLEEKPTPENRTYRALVLENSYLRLTILPELGGRLWQPNVLSKFCGQTLSMGTG